MCVQKNTMQLELKGGNQKLYFYVKFLGTGANVHIYFRHLNPFSIDLNGLYWVFHFVKLYMMVNLIWFTHILFFKYKIQLKFGIPFFDSMKLFFFLRFNWSTDKLKSISVSNNYVVKCLYFSNVNEYKKAIWKV